MTRRDVTIKYDGTGYSPEQVKHINVVPMYPEDEFWERVGAAALKRERLLDQAVKDFFDRHMTYLSIPHQPERRKLARRVTAALWMAYGMSENTARQIRHRFAELSRHA